MSAADSLFDAPAGDFDESLSDDAPHWRRERFIPLRKAALAQRLQTDLEWPAADAVHVESFCRLLEAILHHEYHARLERLKQAYAEFDPDATRPPSAARCEADATPFFQQLFDLLRRANYQRLTQAEIEDAVDATSDWGMHLRVDFGKFEQLGVFARGDIVTPRQRKQWRNFYRSETVDVPIFQRLVVAFQFRNQPAAKRSAESEAQGIFLKLFKNIPKQDVDMLLPGARFQMSLLDQGRILLPTVSGIVIVTIKIIKGALLLIFTGFWGVLAFLAFAGGTLGYGIKSFLGYQRTKDRYQLHLTRSLYYQNLDNNEGVLFRLLDEAEDQDFSEALLAYSLLRCRAGKAGWIVEEIDRAAEAYLSEVLGFAVDFEVSDALRKLERLGCAQRDEHDRWQAVSLSEACNSLDARWDDYFRHSEAKRDS